VDDPQLTTRLVPEGYRRASCWIRRRLSPERRVFTDGQAPSLVIVAAEYAHCRASLGHGVDTLTLPTVQGMLSIRDVLRSLRARGLKRIFVEGGGVTVSRFLDARAVDRLHVAVASRIIGTGAPAIQLDGGTFAGGLLAHAQSYRLGTDVLFDCDLRATDRRGRGLA
jgi:riboflavin biosynthesis pyrimidine reductase